MVENVLSSYPQNFKGLGKLRNHQDQLYMDNSIKPVAVPPRVLPYHLEHIANDTIEKMLSESVIEEHPANEVSPWVSAAVIVLKPDGSLCITLDAHNINKDIVATNHPIPRQEDVRAKLGVSKFFSKLDFKGAFWQLQLHPESRHFTVFHWNNKLYRYVSLLMGIKPASGEMNATLQPVFVHIDMFSLYMMT